MNMEKQSARTGEIILYNVNEKISLKVHFERETVWLSVNQMVLLFDREESNIRRHIINVFTEGELDKNINVQIMHVNGIKKPVPYYSLDVIISVGYRVKSLRGTMFRQWANRVLKEYVMKSAIENQRILDLEKRMETRFHAHETILSQHTEQIEFFVKHALPPQEGIFYNGQIFDAYKFANDLTRSANIRIILIDNYIDDTVLTMFDKRKEQVKATIYTAQISKQLQLDIAKHNEQYRPIDVQIFRQSHDRFLIVDDVVYLIGASLKDLGKKMFAFSKLEICAGEFINQLQISQGEKS